jgi:pilus assembly protein Flp/PilA
LGPAPTTASNYRDKEISVKVAKVRSESGQGLVEYALILFLVAIVVIAVLVLLGPQIGTVFSSVVRALGG